VQGKPLDEEDEQKEKEEVTAKEESPKDSVKSNPVPQFQKLNIVNKELGQGPKENGHTKNKSVNLIDLQDNGKIKIDFDEFQEAPSASNQSTGQSQFAFINKNNGGNSLIDLNSSENIKDTKFKEASDSILKMFNQTQEEKPVVNKNNVPQNKGMPIYNGYPNQMYNMNGYNQNGGGYMPYNGFNNGYQNNFNNNNNNLFYSHSSPLTANTNVHSSDLFNKTNGYEPTNKVNNSLNTKNFDLTTLKVNNEKTDKDPFKSLVNFK